MSFDNNQIIQVDESAHGTRIDSWLNQQFPTWSRNYWIEKIKDGLIKHNQATCLPKTKLKIGDMVFIDATCFVKESIVDNRPELMKLDIIYEDDSVIILNKPAGLVVHPGAGNYEHTLLNGLLAHHANANTLPRAGIVHRLDKDTTGIMIVAKTLAAYHSLVQQLQQRLVTREYYALVYGHIVSGGTIHTQFGRNPKNRLKMAVVNQGKEAITHYDVTSRYPFYTGLNIKLETGRTHQIRVHMSHLGHPLVGDPLYGGRLKLPPSHSDKLKSILQQFKRQALHAHLISFNHPDNQERLTFHASLPDDLSRLISAIDEHYENNNP